MGHVAAPVAPPLVRLPGLLHGRADALGQRLIRIELPPCLLRLALCHTARIDGPEAVEPIVLPCRQGTRPATRAPTGGFLGLFLGLFLVSYWSVPGG